MSWLKRFFLGHPKATRATPHHEPRLSIEELECRLMPSSSADLLQSTSTNWSGYADSTAAGAVTSVSGSWTVPTVTGSGTSNSVAWVGIDGFNSSTVEQTGTQMQLVNGHAEYSAWFELFPDALVTIPSVAIHPGDTIDASVNFNSAAKDFTLSITDATDKESFTTTKSAPNAQRSSAEWIVEAPAVNGAVQPLSNFGSVTFTNAQATINGASGPINAEGSGTTINQITMVNGNTGAVQATPSGLTASGSGFTVTFGPGAAPSPPATPTPAVVTVTSLTGTVNPFSRIPTVTFTATVTAESGSALPTGMVEILDGNTVLGTAQIEDIGGVAEVIFTVEFPAAPGVFNISIDYLGNSSFESSTSNTITVTVT